MPRWKGMTRFLSLVLLGSTLSAAGHVARDERELRAVLAGLKSGDVVKIAPGIYPGGHHVSGVENLTVEALDKERPPVFEGGRGGWHFSACPGLVLRLIHVRGQSVNGINLDEGGAGRPLVKGIRIEGVQVSDIGPSGNHDGIKASGLEGAVIQDCVITGWGGQADSMREWAPYVDGWIDKPPRLARLREALTLAASLQPGGSVGTAG